MHEITKVTAVVLMVLVSGALLTMGPEVYDYDVQFDVEGDNLIFSFDTNTQSPSTAVMFSNCTSYKISEVVALYDSGYASRNPEFLQLEMIDDIKIYFPMLSDISFRVTDTAGMSELMSEDPDGTVAVMFISGTIPDVLYDGTRDCRLVQWLHGGGVLVNVSGCLGKYIAHGPLEEDIEIVSGFGKIFAEVEDEDMMDCEKRLFSEYSCNEEVRDALNLYMNEYTYGVDITEMEDSLNLSYMTKDNQSSATIYRSGGGMVLNFGSSLINHVHFDYNIVKVLASGMDYSSKVLDVYKGGPNGHGEFKIPILDRYSVYAYIGEPRALYGCSYFG